jgi:hypothetical protein
MKAAIGFLEDSVYSKGSKALYNFGGNLGYPVGASCLLPFSVIFIVIKTIRIIYRKCRLYNGFVILHVTI